MCLVLQKYKDAGQDTIILAGAEYGSGSSRDWAAKGPYLQVSKYLISVPILKQTVYCLESLAMIRFNCTLKCLVVVFSIRLLLYSNSRLRIWTGIIDASLHKMCVRED